jgi:phosphoglycerol transferase MdoB-like AlkP superfamily enzyme
MILFYSKYLKEVDIMKNKKKDNIDKVIIWKKRAKWIFIIAMFIIAIELITMFLMNKNKESKITFIDTYNSIYKTNDYYIATGSSNFKYSHYNNIKHIKIKEEKIWPNNNN